MGEHQGEIRTKTPSPQKWQGTLPSSGQGIPATGMQSSTPTKPNTPQMNLTATLSPIQRSGTPTPSTSSRTPMDLYAIIHESKKKIMKLRGRQSPPTESENLKNNPKTVLNWPKNIPADRATSKTHYVSPIDDPLVLPSNGQYQRLSPSPTPFPSYPDRSQYKNSPNRFNKELKSPIKHSFPVNDLRKSPNQYRPSPTRSVVNKSPPRRNFGSLDRGKLLSPKSSERPFLTSDRRVLSQSTSRNDFKQLLLRTGWGSNAAGKPSAVERLKNKSPAPTPAPSPQRKTWKTDVLSSTITEDCDEDDERLSDGNKNDVLKTAQNKSSDSTIPKSSALVSQQSKSFQARSSPTLETAL